MAKLMKEDIVALIASDAGIAKKDAEVILNSTFEIIGQCLMKGYDVNIPKFGKFKLKYVKPKPERTGMLNPFKSEIGTLKAIEEHNTFKFSPSKYLKDQLKEETLGNAFK